MSTKPRTQGRPRKFKVHVERAGEVYTAKIAAVEDAPKVVAEHGLDSGIMDLVNDILIELVREEEVPPSAGHH